MELEKISENGLKLRKCSVELRNNFQFVMAAVGNNPFSIFYASDAMKDCYEIGMIAVSKQGLTIKYLSERLRNNINIAKTAILNNTDSLLYTSVKNNREIAELAIKKDAYSIILLSETLRKDKDIALLAIMQNENTLPLLEPEHKRNRKLILNLKKKSNCFSKNIIHIKTFKQNYNLDYKIICMLITSYNDLINFY